MTRTFLPLPLLLLLAACGSTSGSERIDQALARAEPACTAGSGPLEGPQCAAHSRCLWDRTIATLRGSDGRNVDAAEKSAAADQVYCDEFASGRISRNEFRLKRSEETLGRHRVIEERELGLRLDSAATSQLLGGRSFLGRRGFSPYY